jgi:hypothetical protein
MSSLGWMIPSRLQGIRALFLPLSHMPAGLGLSAVLARFDVRELSGCDRVRYLQALHRVNAAAYGALLDAMNAVAEAYDEFAEDIEDPAGGASFEIRSALRWTRQATEKRTGPFRSQVRVWWI